MGEVIEFLSPRDGGFCSPSALPSGLEYEAFEVWDDSQLCEGFQIGDRVVVDRDALVTEGDMVLLETARHYYFRRLGLAGFGRLTLYTRQPKFPACQYEPDQQILAGRVVSVCACWRGGRCFAVPSAFCPLPDTYRWTADAYGSIIQAESKWCELTAQRNEDAKGWGWLQVVEPADSQHACRSWAHALETKTVWRGEPKILRHDSGLARTHVMARPCFDARGMVAEWVGYARYTERVISPPSIGNCYVVGQALAS